eukprot:TRINITY_DN7854_c0_g1_i1.p1 TRINITY_DN7854_c0_g1~~TRINITY_DN7854_c0_g1_i1.p1  ORF type:complete len:1741 (+),score=694.83 TRINITY_DN7854_c0_g1_i1:185-5407(+)
MSGTTSSGQSRRITRQISESKAPADSEDEDLSPRKRQTRRAVVDSDEDDEAASPPPVRKRGTSKAASGSARPVRATRSSAANSKEYEWIDPNELDDEDFRAVFADELSDASVSDVGPEPDSPDDESDESVTPSDAASGASRGSRGGKDEDEDYDTEAEADDAEVALDDDEDEEEEDDADYHRVQQSKKTGRSGTREPYKKKNKKKEKTAAKEQENHPRKVSKPRQAKTNMSQRRQINLSDYEDGSDSASDSERSAARRAKASKPAPKARTATVYYDEPDKIEQILGHVIVNGVIKVLLKIKDRSYRHTLWLTQRDYERTYSSQLGRLKKHLQYHDIPFVSQLSRKEAGAASDVAQPEAVRGLEADPPGVAHPADVFFPGEYVIIERVIDNLERQYLVKWKGLDYEHCTWEHDALLPNEADQDRIAEYHATIEDRLRRRNGRLRREPRECQGPRTSVPVFRRPELQLREFQVEGFQWLAHCWHQRRSSMLADEMGLGKTVQCLSLLQHMRTGHQIRGPFVVIVPLVTIGHWLNETRRWTDMAVTVFHGTKEQREMIRTHDWLVRDNKGAFVKGVYKWELLITTYEMVVQETALLASVEWECLILDEGHRIKNQKTKLLQRLSDLKTKHKVLLTGTPLQNNTRELWALMNYLDPDEFGSEADFMAKFGELKEAEQVTDLHQVLAPYLLRRLKQDVEKTIPMKEETIVEIELTAIQKAYYRAILDRNREFLARGATRKGNLPRLVNVMMEIRKVCNHPFLTKGAEEYILSSNSADVADSALPASSELLVRSSAKMVLVDKLLPKLSQGNHKVLIFTQMRLMLDLLEEYMTMRGYKYERLDGGVKGSDRQERIDRFCAPDSDRFVFMCTTRAGGLGINLTVADTVIIFDSDWNPQNDLQAQARAHRIGQTANVQVYRLVTRNTYERHMLDVASRKLALDHVVLNTNLASGNDDQAADGDDDQAAGIQKELSHKQIDSLLKFGAYNLFTDDPNAEKEKERMLLDEDIDTILQRSATIKYMDAGGKDELSGFSKATFYTDDAESTVDLEDANFWDKILPKVEKSVDYFRAKFQDKSALLDSSSKAHFLEELAAYAKQVKQTGHVLEATDGGLTVGEAALAKLLGEIELATAHFTQRQRDTLRDLRMLLERPRLRRRPGAETRDWDATLAAMDVAAEADEAGHPLQRDEDSDYSGDERRAAAVGSDSESGSEIDPEAEALDPEGKRRGRRGRRSKGEKAEKAEKDPRVDRRRAPPGTWSKMKRKDLMRSMHSLGFGRWGRLRKESAMLLKTKEEIQAFCECYTQACFAESTASENSFYVTALRDTIRSCRETMVKVACEPPARPAVVGSEASAADELDAKESATKKRRLSEPVEVMDVDAPASATVASASEAQVEIHLRHMPAFYAPGEVISTQLVRQPSSDAVHSDQPGQLFVAMLFHSADCDDPADAAASAINVEIDQLTNLMTLPRRGIGRAFPLPADLSQPPVMVAPGFVGNYSIRVVWVSAATREARSCGPATRFKVAGAENILGAENIYNPKRGTDQRIRQLFVMRDVRNIVRKYGKRLERLVDVTVMANARSPADWWQNPTHDRQLVAGTYRFGYGHWMAMRDHPAFTFLADIPPDMAFPLPQALAARAHVVIGAIVLQDPAFRSVGRPAYSADDAYTDTWGARNRTRHPPRDNAEDEYVLDSAGGANAIPRKRRKRLAEDGTQAWPTSAAAYADSRRGVFDPISGHYVSKLRRSIAMSF